jgi:hypothetical protein
MIMYLVEALCDKLDVCSVPDEVIGEFFSPQATGNYGNASA